MKELKGTKEALEILKISVGAKDKKLDPIFTIWLQELGNRILHYTNLTQVPAGLYYTWSSMAKDLFMVSMPNHELVQDLIEIEGDSISMGDTSVKGNNNSNAGNAGSRSKSKGLEEIVLNYLADLRHYRKMRW